MTTPPTNVIAEQGVLGSILVNNAAHQRVSHALYEEHFAVPLHGRIYAAIGRLIEQGHEANAVTLKNLFERENAIGDIDGGRYLVLLIENAVTVINAPYYAETIIDCYRRRVMIGVAQEIERRAGEISLDDPVDSQIEEANTRLFELGDVGMASTRQTRVTGAEAAQQAMNRAQIAYREPGQLSGISSGIVALDKLIGGFAPGDLYIIGGRPGQGKSALLCSIAWASAEAGYPTIIFSGEMTADQLAARILAALSGVSAGRQRRGDLTATDWDNLITAQARLSNWPLVIDDDVLVLPRLLQRLRQWRRQQRDARPLLMVDYLQLITTGRDDLTRLAEVGRVSNGLKRTAKELDLPVIAAAQLSRQVESRDDKRPVMSDLRYAGELEQDSDAVIFIYRHEVYLGRAEPVAKPGESDVDFQRRHSTWSNALEDARGAAQLLVAKNRHDAEGIAHVRFDAARSYFHDTDASQGRFL